MLREDPWKWVYTAPVCSSERTTASPGRCAEHLYSIMSALIILEWSFNAQFFIKLPRTKVYFEYSEVLSVKQPRPSG